MRQHLEHINVSGYCAASFPSREHSGQ
jgi:hypothetical protein